MILRKATASDFSYVRGIVQRPECAPFLTDEDESGLSEYLADPSALLQILEDRGASAGFALWCNIGGPGGVVELRRLALDKTGTGRGVEFVGVLTDFGFAELSAQKIWLDASAENPRACRVYEQAGYRLEGRQRAHWWRPSLGRVVDVMLYGMLRDEWQTARNALAAPLP